MVRQQPARTHAGARLVWRRQLLRLLRNEHGCLADAWCSSLWIQSAVSYQRGQGAPTSPNPSLLRLCDSREGGEASVTPYQKPCGN